MRHFGAAHDTKAVCTSFGKAAVIAITVSVAVEPATGSADAEAMDWDAVAQCESGGDWSADTGNGFYGGLQFKRSTWDENGGVGSPAKASRDQQIAVANQVLATQGPGAWPKCGGNQVLFPPELVNILRWGNPLRGTLHKLWSKAVPH